MRVKIFNNNFINKRSKKVREILDFFKDIFMIKEETSYQIGLSQLKAKKIETLSKVKQTKKKKELSLSELMRGQAG